MEVVKNSVRTPSVNNYSDHFRPSKARLRGRREFSQVYMLGNRRENTKLILSALLFKISDSAFTD